MMARSSVPRVRADMPPIFRLPPSPVPRQRAGNVAPALAVAMLPLMFSVGSAVDYGRYVARQSEIANALDSAVIAAAVQPDVTVEEAGSIIHRMLAANLNVDADWEVADVAVTDDEVRATFRQSLPTTFMSLAGVERMDISVSAEARRPGGLIEVALVLDNTGSMAGSRISALRSAAAELLTVLEDRAVKPENLKIALVPFVTAVNVAVPGVFDESWIDTTGSAPSNGQNMSGTDPATKNHAAIFQKLSAVKPEWAWKGCVEARPKPYALDDTPPNPSNPSTLFVPWLWPDEPDTPTTTDQGVTVSRYDNSYLADKNSGTSAQRQANLSKYLSGQVPVAQKPTPAAKPFNTHGPNKSCGQPIQPLTANLSVVRQAIAAMRPWDDSGTNVAEGLAWGWRVLSPAPPFSEGAPYSQRTARKYVVVLTDGENVVYGGDSGYAATSHNKSQYTSWGYVAVGRFDMATSISAARDRVDGYLEEVCTAVKATGITVYTITFQLTNATTKDLYRRCASAPDKYYDSPTTAQLTATFTAIARDIAPVRLAR